jgi:zinc transporter ZupT
MFWPLFVSQYLEDNSTLIESLEALALVFAAAAAMLLAIVLTEVVLAALRKDHELPTVLRLGGTIPRL